MLFLLRILACTQKSLLEQISQGQPVVSESGFINEENEAEMLRFLEIRCKLLLRMYPNGPEVPSCPSPCFSFENGISSMNISNFTKEDEKILSDPNLPFRKRQLVQLRLGEKRILNSVLEEIRKKKQ